MFGPAARSPRSPELFSCDIGMLYSVIFDNCSEQNFTLAALSPPNTILPSAHVAKVVCLVARRWALPAPLATTHAAFNLHEKRTGRPPCSDRPSSTHWEERSTHDVVHARCFRRKSKNPQNCTTTVRAYVQVHTTLYCTLIASTVRAIYTRKNARLVYRRARDSRVSAL